MKDEYNSGEDASLIILELECSMHFCVYTCNFNGENAQKIWKGCLYLIN